MTSERESLLKNVYANIKDYFILDAHAFIKSLNIDMTKRTSIYLANDELQQLINSQLKLKKNKGVIYINKNLSEDLYFSFKEIFGKKGVKIVLIDNGQFPKHEDIMTTFDEVIFYERFRKTKIIDCEGLIPPKQYVSNVNEENDDDDEE